jgi:formylglycine-generating enzyme required for sulfatase activity
MTTHDNRITQASALLLCCLMLAGLTACGKKEEPRAEAPSTAGSSASVDEPGSQVQTRVALLIGNASYKESPLKNPVNDVRAMAAALKKLGFTVIQRENLSQDQIGQTLREFRTALKPGSEAIFFYAGHGMQIKGVNYLPVVDARIESEEDVPNQSISLNQVMDILNESRTRLNLVFLDACRNNPFSRGFRSGAAGGLARVEAASGTLISFATRPGSVAADGEGEHGLYTEHLLTQMQVPDQPIEMVLKATASAVKRASQSKQEPWQEGNIDGDFYFVQNKIATPPMAPVAVIALPSAPATAQPTPEPYAVGSSFRDCNDNSCPEMVVIPSGSFMMGSNDGEDDEKPVHRVEISYRLAVGKYEVTFEEWDACSNAGGCSHRPDDKGWGRGRRPVINVSWDDAQQYVRWLSQKTGQQYRLLSESEWEYAARAGSTTKYSFGESEQGNYAWYDENSGGFFSSKQTHPVGEKRQNAFGLYDMHGNVWEWVQDRYRDNYNGAPGNGAAVEGNNSARCVLRGGSWYHHAFNLRAASRYGSPPSSRSKYDGFRLARTRP